MNQPCVVLAGGLGTRLRSAVPDLPKCLAPVGERSFLEIQLQALAAQGFDRFVLSLATDTSMITAIGNDYGYDKLFRRQLEAQARRGDMFVGITTSGRSKNVLEAFKVCKDLGVTSVALCGSGGELEPLVDHVLRAPSAHTPRIQECHILIGHMLCAQVELGMFAHLQPAK